MSDETEDMIETDDVQCGGCGAQFHKYKHNCPRCEVPNWSNKAVMVKRLDPAATADEVELAKACDAAERVIKSRIAFEKHMTDDCNRYIDEQARARGESRAKTIAYLTKSQDATYEQLLTGALQARRERISAAADVLPSIIKRQTDRLAEVQKAQAALVESHVLQHAVPAPQATTWLIANSATMKALRDEEREIRDQITMRAAAVTAIAEKAAMPQPAFAPVDHAVDARSPAHRELDRVVQEYATANGMSIASAFTSLVGPGGSPEVAAMYRTVATENAERARQPAPPMTRPA